MKEETQANKGFDLRTHVRDGKGNIVKEQPYRLHIEGDKRKFERPPGSGWFYTEGGELIAKPKGQNTPPKQAKKEFSNNELLKEIAELKAKLAEKEENAVEELPEVHLTAQDVEVDDIPQVPASQADNSEEIALMKEAGVGLKGLGAANPAQAQEKKGFWNK